MRARIILAWTVYIIVKQKVLRQISYLKKFCQTHLSNQSSYNVIVAASSYNAKESASPYIDNSVISALEYADWEFEEGRYFKRTFQEAFEEDPTYHVRCFYGDNYQAGGMIPFYKQYVEAVTLTRKIARGARANNVTDDTTTESVSLSDNYTHSQDEGAL